MASMDSTMRQLHIQIPQLPRPGDVSNALGPDSATSSCADSSTILPFPRSAFDFSWVPEPHASRSPTASWPPRSSPSSASSAGYRYSFGARQQQLSAGHCAGTSPSPTSASKLQHPAGNGSGNGGSNGSSNSHGHGDSNVGSPASSFSPSTSAVAPPLLSLPGLAAINIHSAAPTSSTLQASSSSCSPTGASCVHSATAPSSPTSISPRTTKPPVKMPPRPAKRAANSCPASDDDAPTVGKPKLARLERGPEDFSSVVKNRLQSYSRTGQACDRCKVRKIRCDALPEGCSHCVNLSLECYVTDRVTGRTERRGYMQQLEREKNAMISHIRDLERLCAEKGVDVKPWEQSPTPAPSPSEADPSDSCTNGVPASTENWERYGSLWIKEGSSPPVLADAIIRQRIPRNEWRTRPEESHWGVVGDDAPLSSLKGTTLTLLGTTIETTSFDAPDVDEPPIEVDPSMPLYNKSAQAFLRSIMGVNPAVQVQLPNRDNAFMYAEWYFISIACFMPVLHKPTFMKLLRSTYDDPDFKPSVTQLVLVHMVFAHILFQFGVRNSQTLEQRNNFNDLSNKHYHFALSKMYDIYSSSEFEGLQGLVLIASHTRSFPKPGCGSMVANMALHRALELNLHRRASKPGEPTNLQNELRKRAFWCIMTVVVAINGKRGYPIPVSVQDFDTEFPEPIADELLSDDGVDTSRVLPCPYEVAICGYKIIPIVMEMYTNVFSVRRDQDNYKNVLAALEAQMDRWEAQLPDSMRLNPVKSHDQEMVGPLFARTFLLEFRLHIRHPSLAMTNDKDMIAENTRICEEAAREYLETVEHLSKMKALDTTWYQLSVYCVAILSMLVPQWERRFQISQEEVATLRKDMDRWMDIVKEMSTLLGCGTGMSTQIAQLIDRTMAWIEYDMEPKKKEGSFQASVVIKQEQQHPLQTILQHPPTEQQLHQSASYPQHSSIPPPESSHRNDPSKAYYPTSDPATSHATYPSLTYTDQQAPPDAHQTVPYQHDQTGLFYPATTAADHPAGHTQSGSLVSYGHHLGQQSSDVMWRTPWQNWSAAIADSQAQYSANALLTLGGAGAGRSAVVTPILTDTGMSQMLHSRGELPMVPQPAQWPLIMFDQTPQE